VAAVRISQLSRGRVQDGADYGDEHVRGISLAELIIDLAHEDARLNVGRGPGLDEGLGECHKEGRRDSLAGGIPYHDAEVFPVYEEKVIEISAHLPGRHGKGMDIEIRPVRKGRELLREDTHLDVPGYLQLAFHSLSSGRGVRDLPDVVLQRRLHAIEGGCKLSDLIPRPHLRHVGLEVARPYPSRYIRHLRQRPRYGPGYEHNRKGKEHKAADAQRQHHMIEIGDVRHELVVGKQDTQRPPVRLDGDIGHDTVLPRPRPLHGTRGIARLPPYHPPSRIPQHGILPLFRDGEDRFVHDELFDGMGDKCTVLRYEKPVTRLQDPDRGHDLPELLQ